MTLNSRPTLLLLSALLALAASPSVGVAAGPDVIVSDLYDTERWGEVGNMTAYSLATYSCNIGDQPLEWVSFTNEHPVIAQNLYRLQDGRFEQLGQSWLKHGFFAVNDDFCDDCSTPGGDQLGPGCGDPYSAGLNGDQGNLGPRSEVNAASGVFDYPFGGIGQSGDAIYKRLQVPSADVDPDLNDGASYFVEGQYVTADDAASENAVNNASYRRVSFDGNLNMAFEGATVQQKSAIQAWQAADPDVEIFDLDIPGDGRLTVAARVTDLGDRWSYEYAVHNLNSHRSGGSFTVPVPAGATVENPGFHDVASHSGEPFATTDWTATPPGPIAAVRWATESFLDNPDANALRWGTLYNFRFESDQAPGTGILELGLFRPGTPTAALAALPTPGGESLCGDRSSFDFSQDPLVRGQAAQLTASGALPGEEVFFLRATKLACGRCPAGLGNLCLDLDSPKILGSAVADATGTATFTLTLPQSFPPEIAATQAVIVRGVDGADSVKSNAVVGSISDG